MSVDVAKAVAVTAELTGTELSPEAARVLIKDLAAYPDDQVIRALDRCRKELRGRLTLAAIIDRLDDGRPGAEEAWGMIPQSEDETVVWTDEMAAAYGAASRLIAAGEPIPARMAFIEKYRALVTEARAEQKPPKWSPSLGRDVHDREAKITEAVDRGRLSFERAKLFLPNLNEPPKQLAGMARQALNHKESDDV